MINIDFDTPLLAFVMQRDQGLGLCFLQPPSGLTKPCSIQYTQYLASMFRFSVTVQITVVRNFYELLLVQINITLKQAKGQNLKETTNSE